MKFARKHNLPGKKQREIAAARAKKREMLSDKPSVQEGCGSGQPPLYTAKEKNKFATHSLGTFIEDTWLTFSLVD